MDFHDPISAGTHLAFAAWCLFATGILVRLTRPHPAPHRAAVLAYGLGATVLYAVSGTFHAVRFASPDEFQIFRRLDFSAIFALVIGSELPVFVYLLRGRVRVACVLVVCVLGVVGVVAVWVAAVVPLKLMIGVYAGLAAVGLLPLYQYARRVGWRGVRWLLASVGVYAIGGVCEFLKWPVIAPDVFGHHELLHVTDMLGTLTHFAFVVRFVIGVGPGR